MKGYCWGGDVGAGLELIGGCEQTYTCEGDSVLRAAVGIDYDTRIVWKYVSWGQSRLASRCKSKECASVE
jgi:hypothetical protein